MFKYVNQLELVLRNIWCDWTMFGTGVTMFFNYFSILYYANLGWLMLLL